MKSLSEAKHGSEKRLTIANNNPMYFCLYFTLLNILTTNPSLPLKTHLSKEDMIAQTTSGNERFFLLEGFYDWSII